MTDTYYRPSYARSAAELWKDVAAAEKIAPKKLRGYTVEKLREMATKFDFLTTCTPEEFNGPNGAAWKTLFAKAAP